MTDLTRRVGALEEDVKDIKAVLKDTVVPMLTRVDERLHHAATRAELESVRNDLVPRLAQVDSGVAQAATQAEVEAVRASVAALPGRGFVIGTVIALFALCAGMVAATVATLQYADSLP